MPSICITINKNHLILCTFSNSACSESLALNDSNHTEENVDIVNGRSAERRVNRRLLHERTPLGEGTLLRLP